MSNSQLKLSLPFLQVLTQMAGLPSPRSRAFPLLYGSHPSDKRRGPNKFFNLFPIMGCPDELPHEDGRVRVIKNPPTDTVHDCCLLNMMSHLHTKLRVALTAGSGREVVLMSSLPPKTTINYILSAEMFGPGKSVR